MAWLSILPENLSSIETWVARICLVLGFITIGPWLLLLAYDFFLFVWRAATYEIPVVGGRARGRQRPRAPSLTKRPSGHRRKISINPVASATSRPECAGESEHRERAMDGKSYELRDSPMQNR